MHIELIHRRAFDMHPLLAELAAHPQAWNEHPARTQSQDSPHREASDIWVRFFPADNLGSTREKEVIWYPVAEKLPTARSIAEELMSQFAGLALGGILITKIPPGKRVYPHIDLGWHARTYEKFAVQVRGNWRQAFHFEGESLVTEEGDLFWFDNSYSHWVTNDSDEDRITLIVCMRLR